MRAACARSSPAPAARRTCPACWPPRPPCRCSACRCQSKHLQGVDSLLLDRADAQGHAGGDVRDRRRRRGQRGAVRGRDAGGRRPGACARSSTPFRATPDRGGARRWRCRAERRRAQSAARRSRDSWRPHRPGDARRAGRRPARPHVRARRAGSWATASRCSTPIADSPAGRVGHHHIARRLPRCERAWRAGSRPAAEAVTTEFENVPADGARAPRRNACRWRPAADAVADRAGPRREKAISRAAAFPCAPLCGDRTRTTTCAASTDALLPGILKTARLGYDGKGQVRVDDARRAGARAWAGMKRRAVRARASCCRCALRDLGDRRARRRRRAVATLPVAARTCTATASSPSPWCRRAHRAGAGAAGARATRPASPTALDYVGVLCVEFFVLERTARWSSTRWRRGRTTAATTRSTPAMISQFEQQVRTLAGLPLGAPRQHSAGGDAQPAGRPRGSTDGARRASPTGRGVLRAAGRAPAPVRQGRGAAGPQDGPRHRGHRPASRPHFRVRLKWRACSASRRHADGNERGAVSRRSRPRSSARDVLAPAAWSPFRPKPSTASAPMRTRPPAVRHLRRQGPAQRPSR